MKIVATSNPVTVDYRVNGKFYSTGAPPDGTVPQNTAERSDYPFDSIELAVGQEFDTAGSDLVRVRDMIPLKGEAEAPVNG